MFYCAALVWISCPPPGGPHFSVQAECTHAVGPAWETPHLPPASQRAGQHGCIWQLTQMKVLPQCLGPWHLAGTWWELAPVWVGGCPVPLCSSGYRCYRCSLESLPTMSYPPVAQLRVKHCPGTLLREVYDKALTYQQTLTAGFILFSFFLPPF